MYNTYAESYETFNEFFLTNVCLLIRLSLAQPVVNVCMFQWRGYREDLEDCTPSRRQEKEVITNIKIIPSYYL